MKCRVTSDNYSCVSKAHHERIANLNTTARDRFLDFNKCRVMTQQQVKFVGRQRETALAEGLLEDEIARRGSLLYVTGEPGVGKSRFVEKAAVAAGRKGFREFSADWWDSSHSRVLSWSWSCGTGLRSSEASCLCLHEDAREVMIAAWEV